MAAFQHAVHAACACLTRAQIKSSDSPQDGDEYTLTFTPQIVPLGRNRVLSMRLHHNYRGVQRPGGWSVLTTGYAYWLFDQDGAELVLYQWDPNGPGPVKTPHLHIGKAMSRSDVPAAVRRRFARLAAAHLPTGVILVTDILRVTIRDFGAEPMRRSPTDATAVDWNSIDRLFRDADAMLQASFA